MKRWQKLGSATILSWAIALCGIGAATAQTKPEGEMRFALYVTLAPAWLDPGEAIPGFVTPFWVLVALHDALVKPMPGHRMAPSLAESWSESEDRRVYEFILRKGLKFHNGDPFTAEDVKFSFERAKGAQLKEKVKEVVIVDPYKVRFVLHEPWPDFMTIYGTFASAAGWIVPKNYFEKVGADGFKKQPIGLGPYKFVSMKPGIELVMEANEDYWRKVPSVKRIVFQSVPEGDHPPRDAEARRSGRRLPAGRPARRVDQERPETEARLLRRHRHEFSRFLRHVGSEIALARPARAQGGQPGDRPQGAQRRRYARRLQAQRQHRAEKHGISRCRSMPTRTIRRRRKSCSPRRAIRTGSTPANSIRYRPISAPARRSSAISARSASRLKLRTMERAAFYSALGTKKLKGVCFCSTAIYGNASTRISEIVPSSGNYAYGGWPDIDELYKQQLSETDPKKREAMLHQIQKTLHERTRFAPIWDYFWPSGTRAARRGSLADEDRSVSVVGAAGGCAVEAAVSLGVRPRPRESRRKFA